MTGLSDLVVPSGDWDAGNRPRSEVEELVLSPPTPPRLLGLVLTGTG